MSGMLKEMDVGKTKTIVANNSRDVSLISALTSNLEQLEYLLLKYNDIIDIIIKRKYHIAKKDNISSFTDFVIFSTATDGAQSCI